MDPNPSNHPILSFVMSKLPSFSSPRFSAAPPPDDFDIEQPPPPSPSKEPYFELTERMPHLTDSKVLAAMRLAIADVSTARSVLKTLGERPDHETVDTARTRLAEIDFELSKQLEEIVLSPRPDETDRADWRSDQAAKEEENRQEREKERQMYKAVISLDEMHESYANLLSDAERRLEKIYETAKDGSAAEENSGETSAIVAEEEVNEEVVRILEDALGNGVERIDLSERRMRFLPEAFGKLRTLVVLNLSSNQFEVIPDSIAGLENLEELNLSSNQLGSLPDSIGLLLKLKILDVSSNKLTCLPDSICHCRSLVELDASLNKLTYIPTNIGFELVNLRRLSIQLNKIRSFPTSIGEMRSLQYLDAHFNELRGLPLAIGRLSNLEVLNLSSNFSDLTELPHTVGDLTNLKECDLSNNQIHELPVTFGRLENLTKLNLDQNPIVIPPVEVINQGIEAVKMFLAKRWLDVLVKEEERSGLEMQEETKDGWLTRSTSWLNNAVTSVSGYLAKSNADPYLDQQL